MSSLMLSLWILGVLIWVNKAFFRQEPGYSDANHLERNATNSEITIATEDDIQNGSIPSISNIQKQQIRQSDGWHGSMWDFSLVPIHSGCHQIKNLDHRTLGLTYHKYALPS